MLELAGMASAVLMQPMSGRRREQRAARLAWHLAGREPWCGWELGKVLTSCVIKGSFGGDDAKAHYLMVVVNMRTAACTWEVTCGVRFAY